MEDAVKQNAFKPVEVEKNIFWVGYADFDSGLSNNPYLVISDKDAMLIDPGPGNPQLFKIILNKVREVLNGKTQRIKFLICSHIDPDVCASLPLWEEYVHPKAVILATSKTLSFLPYYGTNLRMVPLKDNDVIILGPSRNLRVIQTPYVHAAGSMMLYDLETGTLFSSDLFGAFSVDFELFADPEYLGKAINFTTVYFGSQEALKKAIEKLREFDIKTICPQHGSVIKSHIRIYLDVFQRLEPAELLKCSRKEPRREDLVEMVKRGSISLKELYENSVDMDFIFEKTGIKRVLDTGYVTAQEVQDIGWNIFKFYGDVPYLHYVMGVSKYAVERNVKNPLFTIPNTISWEKVKNLPESTPKLISNIMNRYLEKNLSSFLGSESYEDYIKEKISTSTTTGILPEVVVVLNVALVGLGRKKYSHFLDDVINTYLISIINTLKEFGARYEDVPGVGFIVVFNESQVKSAFICALSLLYRAGRIKRRKGVELDISIGMVKGRVNIAKYSKEIVGKGVDEAIALRKIAQGGNIILKEEGLGEVVETIIGRPQYQKYFKFKKGKLVPRTGVSPIKVIKVERI